MRVGVENSRGKNGDTYEGLQEHTQAANENRERNVSGHKIYSGSWWQTIYVLCLRGVKINQCQILLSSFCSVCAERHYFQMDASARRYPDHGLMKPSLSATCTSFGAHNIFRGSNRRFRIGWTGGQTEFIVIISPMSPLTCSNRWWNYRFVFVVTLLSYRDYIE